MVRPGAWVPGLVWMLVQTTAGAQPAPRPEYQVKAQYLGMLCKDYTQWPGNAGLEDYSQPFRIGVLGESPFQDFLETIVAAKPIKGHKVRIKVTTRILELLDSHVLFICESEADRLTEVLRVLRGMPILTFGDTPEFASRGVMVNFIMQQMKVGFEINHTALKAHGLEINPQVLSFAKIVK